MLGSRPGALTGERVNTRRLPKTVCWIRALDPAAGLVILSHIVVIQSRSRSHFARPALLSPQGQNLCGGGDGGHRLYRIAPGSKCRGRFCALVLEFTINLPGPDLHINPSNIPHLASGGPVRLGKTYLVGEPGPELFTARSAGRIISNHQLTRSHFNGPGPDPTGIAAGGGPAQRPIVVNDRSGDPARTASEVLRRAAFAGGW
jgi:hypothetical protein